MVVSLAELDVAQTQALQSARLDPITRDSIIAALGGSAADEINLRYPSILDDGLAPVQYLDVDPPGSVSIGLSKMPWVAGIAEEVTWSDKTRAAANGEIGPLVPRAGDPLPSAFGRSGRPVRTSTGDAIITGGASSSVSEQPRLWLWGAIVIICAVAIAALRTLSTGTVGWIIIGVCAIVFITGWYRGALP